MNPFDLLGIDDDADERAIKRAYALRLRTTRPDDDPVAFQQLNEAYQWALQHARWREQFGDDDEEDHDVSASDAAAPALHASMHAADGASEHDLDSVVVAEAPRPHVPVPVEPLRTSESIELSLPDAGGLADEIVARAAHDSAADLDTWLAHHDALYNLRLKHEVGHLVFNRLAISESTFGLDRLGVLGRFFDRDDHALRDVLRMRWAIRNDQTAEYGEPEPRFIRQLKRPFAWPRALMLALVPGVSARMRDLAQQFIRVEGDLPDALDAGQYAFFQRIADPDYFGAWRWPPMIIRAALVAAIAAVVIPWAATRSFSPMAIGAIAFATVFGLQFGLHALGWINARMAGAVNVRETPLALLPVWLALLALALDAVLPTSWPSLVLAGFAALAHWRRTFDAVRFLLGGLAMHASVSAFDPQLSMWVVGLACVPLGLTLFDAIFAHRHSVPLHAAAGNRWTMLWSYAFLIGWVLQRAFMRAG